MTIGLYLLRVFQMGLRMADLEDLTYGQVIDMMTESANDNENYSQLATQADFDRF